jgi:glycosyltransferase involved in cell wall biosynthesis
VGRLEPYKGGVIAIRAFARASPGTEASMEVIGAGSEGAVLRREVAEADLGERVVFTGALPQVETLSRIANLDVLLVPSLTTPSWKEQFGRVAAQAMAAGTAVVASDSGSLREVVGDGGVLVPEGDVGAFANQLRELLLDESRAAAIGERGRRRAGELMSWESVSDRVDEMYRQMLGS